MAGSVSGSGGEVRLVARTEFANNKDITIALKVDGTGVAENPCTANKTKGRLIGNGARRTCSCYLFEFSWPWKLSVSILVNVTIAIFRYVQVEFLTVLSFLKFAEYIPGGLSPLVCRSESHFKTLPTLAWHPRVAHAVSRIRRETTHTSRRLKW
jgi:hypothetical protein